MTQITQIKQELLSEIETLPEHRLPEVLDFVHFLHYQEDRSTATPPPADAARDPLLQFIGGVEHGKLAHGIDQELYAQ